MKKKEYIPEMENSRGFKKAEGRGPDWEENSCKR